MNLSHVESSTKIPAREKKDTQENKNYLNGR